MRRIFPKREQRCFGITHNVASSHVFSKLNHLKVITKQCRQHNMLGIMFHLLCVNLWRMLLQEHFSTDNVNKVIHHYQLMDELQLIFLIVALFVFYSRNDPCFLKQNMMGSLHIIFLSNFVDLIHLAILMLFCLYKNNQ